jgi:hypothetical protein
MEILKALVQGLHQFSLKKTGDVVFGISEKLIHNYLLPRECPRVTFYAGNTTTEADRKKHLGLTTAAFVMVVETNWLSEIMNTVLYCYKFPANTFELLDEEAGYYISYETIIPKSKRRINNVLQELLARNIELWFAPSITELAESIKNSTLKFSLIRMRNAKAG